MVIFCKIILKEMPRQLRMLGVAFLSILLLLFNNPIKILAVEINGYSPYESIYKSAAQKYNVDWEVIAGIHWVETKYSTVSPMISYAGAVGHTQFMPATWAGWIYNVGGGLVDEDLDYTNLQVIRDGGGYGVDANGNGKADPFELEDAIFTTAKYLSNNGYSENLYNSVFQYNHADWYVEDVLEAANQIRSASGGTGTIGEGTTTPVGNEKPYNLRIRTHSTGVNNLEWDFDGEFVRFDVYKASYQSDGVYEKIGSSTTKSFADDYLENSVTWYYKVVAIHPNGSETWSSYIRETNPITVIRVNLPLRIVETFRDKVTLEHGFNGVPYEVYMDGKKVYTTNSTSFTIHIDDVQPNKVYKFHVKTSLGYTTNSVDVIFDNDLDTSLNTAINKIFEPSDEAINRLKDAIEALKNALGANQAIGAGNTIKDGLENVGANLTPEGNFSKFRESPDLPGLDGTDTPWTIKFPITVKMDGSFLYAEIFTEEQMAKMKWWDNVRLLLEASMWITFGVWLIARFTPVFKT
jgi:hypothetical protein